MATATRFIRVISTELKSQYDYLQSIGIDPYGALGTGSFGAVYDHPTNPDRVIKVLNKADPAYLNYVQCIMRLRKHSPFLPVIHDAKRVLILPKYRLTLADFGKREYARRKSSFLMIELDRLDAMGYDYDSKASGGAALYNMMTESNDRLGIADAYRKLHGVDRVPRTVQIAQAVLRRMIAKGHGEDCHRANVMLLADQLVLTDPVYNASAFS